MRFMLLLLTVAVAASCVDAGLLRFRPLSAQQVYNVLRAAKREDAVPQGRVITQGLAAMTGFAAGIAMGIGVPLVFNIDLANVTGITAWLNGQSSASSSGGSSTSSTSSATQLQTQEICFNSRAAYEIDDGDDDVDDAVNVYGEPVEKESASGFQTKHVRAARALRKSTARYNHNEDESAVSNYEADEQYSVTPTGEAVEKIVSLPTATATSTSNAANSPTTAAETTNDTQPSATNTQTNTGTAGTSGTGTNTVSTTDTGNQRAVNCIVIQKPAVG